MKCGKGFTLIELMVVIIIIGILAAIAAPLMLGRADKSKWTEARTTAGLIRRSIRDYATLKGMAEAQALVGNDLSDSATQTALGFAQGDLEGNYFSTSDYVITSINGDGLAAITATGGSKPDSPSGSYVMQSDGTWEKQ